MIDEEKILINGDASLPLGTTPTPTLTQSTLTGYSGTFAGGAIFVVCVALTGMGQLAYSPFVSATNTGGIVGQVTKVNADASTDTYGGGSAQPSAEATIGTVTAGNVVTATVALVSGAFAYAWYVGTVTGTEYLAGITPTNQAIFTKVPAATNQPVANLKVSSSFVDNSVDQLVPDGILTQVFGAVTGPSPGQFMSTNPLVPNNITYSPGGSIIYTMPAGNTGLTIGGSNFAEIDAVLRAAYEQYKVGFDRILISAADVLDSFGAMLGQASSNNSYRIWFDADQETGRIVAGRRVTSYLNKFFNNTLDIEIHPYIPPGCLLFWSDKSPYELSGVANLLEAKVRQDYYQIQWPWRSRRYEYGVYVDEVFPCYFTPAFAAIINKNPATGSMVF
jgi:hypothetical protein